MIRINSLKLPVIHSSDDILNAASEKLHLNTCDISELKIVKKSLDARDKANIRWNYIADISCENEEAVLRANRKNRNICPAPENKYVLPKQGQKKQSMPPCIIGSGPAGLFCAYFLAKEGYKPVLAEQGEAVPERLKSAEKFWNEGFLNPRSNVQFGEGGAGTFSDGKLYTGVNDRAGRKTKVLETFVENGAPKEILYANKPHIGTDILSSVVVNMRKKITGWGGQVLFNTKFADFAKKDDKIISIALETENQILIKPCSVLVLAVGNSARDTFYMLYESGLKMEAKAFAVGIRAEHLQSDIDAAMYGSERSAIYGGLLPPADYKLTYRAKDGRGVYSFCMCPGGYVINSSSEEGRLCVNGMSYSGRNGKKANSAIVVTVTPEDTASYGNVLGTIEFQRLLEQKAYEAGGGAIPAQLLRDFNDGTESSFEDINTRARTKGAAENSDINKILPEYICRDIKEAFEEFGRRIEGFDSPDTVLYAVESRTSCPVRILRDENLESNIKGIFPAGEGAGYAGGITSSAIDGIRVFEEIYKRYSP